MASLVDELRVLCANCIMAPQNRNQEWLLPACGQCVLKHRAADEIERLQRESDDLRRSADIKNELARSRRVMLYGS